MYISVFVIVCIWLCILSITLIILYTRIKNFVKHIDAAWSTEVGKLVLKIIFQGLA